MTDQLAGVERTTRLVALLQTLRIGMVDTEHEIHQALRTLFAAASLPFAHEVQLAPRCRIDFVVQGIGVEVKKGKPNAVSVTAQLARYASTGALAGVILVVERSVSQFSLDVIAGIPVRVVALNKLWGVAL